MTQSSSTVINESGGHRPGEQFHPTNTSPFDEIEPADITARVAQDFPFSMGEVEFHFGQARSFPAEYYSMAWEVRDRARRFADKVIRPVAVEIDRRVSREPEYFAWDVMRAACPHRFFSMLIPPQFDGMGCFSLQMAVMAEELAVGCGGLASTIGVHSAGISCGMISMDPFILEKFVRPVARAEMDGQPILWSGAVTEPNAGTDIWDEDFLEKARIMTVAKKVSGGYVLNGRKCFISNGNVAKISIVAAALDPKNARESWSVFLVPTDAKGFSVGRVERKMGQRASPAAELIFEDLFLPKEHLVGEEGMGARYVSVYLAGSRGPVGAIGAGIARRALECLVEWAKTRKTRRGRMIDQQAVQLAIARMAKQIVEARYAYVAAAIACDRFLADIIHKPLVKATLGVLPSWFILHSAGQKLLRSRPVKNIIRNILDNAIPDDRLALAGALATIAKCKGSDVGVSVSGEAARIMGPDCADPRWPVEKCWRDAKLTQIYEGTNQANTITAFKNMAKTWTGN